MGGFPIFTLCPTFACAFLCRTEHSLGGDADSIESQERAYFRPCLQRTWEFATDRIAERFVRTARSESLDWLLILSVRHLERALTVFIDHYNGWRPHRSLDLAPPNGRTSSATWTRTQPITVKRRDRLGGLLHEYERAA